MKKKTNIRTAIRQIVREEVAMAIKEVITELQKPTQQVSKPTPQKKHFSQNSVLNDVLNETANGDDWKTLGGTKYTTERMSEVVGGSYGDIMSDNSNSNTGVTIDGQTADFLQKDYRGLMKKIKEKRG
jgi:hypothetical protein